jgi:thiol-disulfide isomerase/thioredoxin
MSSNISFPLAYGHSYPFKLLGLSQESELNRVVCAISLNCAHCIRLLPLLKEFKKNPIFEFLLITNGKNEENAIIRAHFGFQFQIISYANRDYSEIGITATPQAYLVNRQGKVINHKKISQIDDLKALWREGEEIDTNLLS